MFRAFQVRFQAIWQLQRAGGEFPSWGFLGFRFFYFLLSLGFYIRPGFPRMRDLRRLPHPCPSPLAPGIGNSGIAEVRNMQSTSDGMYGRDALAAVTQSELQKEVLLFWHH